VTRRGQLIFDLDRAAWVTTDDMRPLLEPIRAALRNEEKNGHQVTGGGWIVERKPDRWVASFYEIYTMALPTFSTSGRKRTASSCIQRLTLLRIVLARPR